LLHCMVESILGGTQLNFCSLNLLSGATLLLSDGWINLLDVTAAHTKFMDQCFVSLTHGLRRLVSYGFAQF